MTPEQHAACVTELEILERLGDKGFSIQGIGRNKSLRHFLERLKFLEEDMPGHLAALRRLIDRDILRIVDTGTNFALATVNQRATEELNRLQAETSDPAHFLEHLGKELTSIMARIRGGVEDPEALLASGGRILEQAIVAIQRAKGGQQTKQ